MRLVCTNCGAQYEVPDDVIPQGGRDVQCSSCGHTWFQPHPDNDAGLAEELDEGLDQPAYSDEPEPQPEPEFEAEAGEAPETAPDDGKAEEYGEDAEFAPEPGQSFEPEPEPQPQDTPSEGHTPDDEGLDAYAGEWDDEAEPGYEEPAYEEDYAEPEEEAAVAAAPMRRQLDPSISDLLREEAKREAKARAAESSHALEHQPELGLTEPEDEASRRARESRARMARLRGEEQPDTTAQPNRAAVAAAATGAVPGRSRRDMLPDIEEINSTLRSASDRRPAEADDHDTPGKPASTRGARRRGRNSGRRAFAFILLVFAFLLCLYVFAPQIARTVPALSDIMSNYVAAVNKLRIWLDGQVQQLMIWLDGKAAESAGTTAPAASGAATDATSGN